MSNQEDNSSRLRTEIISLRRRIEELEAESAKLERTRQLLKEEHSFRKTVIDRVAEGLCVCHSIPEFPFVQFTVWNDRMAEISGYSMEEINRCGWYQTMYSDPEIQDRAQQRMSQMREGMDLQHERWEITRADGEIRSFEIATSILTTHDGQTHVLALMQDVTDEEQYLKLLKTRVANLEGILPICASCKDIRNDKGDWKQLENYISEHSEAMFTSTICPNCMKKLYPGLPK